ncbi:MAG: cellulase family glycosylhydrolase [Spirochaetaceae bacterium]|jgi:endoglucanase|nr:cellulase family glycosylhydrolase [Spirochaetaceae bacterium]
MVCLTKKRTSRTSWVVGLIILPLTLLLGGCVSQVGSNNEVEGIVSAPFGQLQVVGTQLSSEDGQPIQLTGMSTMGLQWYGGIVNPDAFDGLVYDWESNVIRLALYVGEDGYSEHPELKDLVRKGIELAIQREVYVVVDWHVLTPGNPNDPVYSGAMNFFDEISRDYGQYPHVIYEIMNEPNGDLDWSTDLKPYAEKMVDVIRTNDPDNIILIGSGTWSQDVDIAAMDPVEGENLMYTVHFYSGTHGQELRDKIDKALELGAPIFSSEWGTSQASGTGGPFITEAQEWLDFFDQRGISWVNWSLANKNETSAAFKALIQIYNEKQAQKVILQEETPLVPTGEHPDGYKYWPVDELSVSGAFVRTRIKGLPAPKYRQDIHTWDFEEGELQGWSIADDSPVKPELSVITAGEKSGAGYQFAWKSQAVSDAWSTAPRLRIGDTNKPIAEGNSVGIELLLESGSNVAGQLELNVIMQYPPSWWTQLPALKFNYKDGEDLGNGYLRYMLDIPYSAQPEMELKHMLLILVGTGSGYEGDVIFDKVAIQKISNGDGGISLAAPVEGEEDVPDQAPPAPLGEFSRLPWTFDDQTRQGWFVTEDSPAQVIPRIYQGESAALGFSYAWSVPGPDDPWNAAPRLSSPWVDLQAKDYNTLSLEIFIEDNQSQGTLQVQPVIQSPQHGYWFQLDPQSLEDLDWTASGEGLRKYSLKFDLISNTGAAFAPDAIMRNLILITIGLESDYRGKVLYDNVIYQ